MNVTLWILQALLALHTAMGAIWKFSKTPAETMPSLATIPQNLWITLSAVELVAAVCLVIPALNKSWGIAAPIAAAVIAIEMLSYCGIHLQSGATEYAPLGYWLVVVLCCSFIALGRLVLKPI